MAVINLVCLGWFPPRIPLLKQLPLSLINSALGFVNHNAFVIRALKFGTNDVIAVRTAQLYVCPSGLLPFFS